MKCINKFKKIFGIKRSPTAEDIKSYWDLQAKKYKNEGVLRKYYHENISHDKNILNLTDYTHWKESFYGDELEELMKKLRFMYL